MHVLHVTEKPSVARTLSNILSPSHTTTKASKYTSNHTFKYELNGVSCNFTVTSVLGHLYSTDFSDKRRWDQFDPKELFEKETESEITEHADIARNLRKIKKDMVMVWTDCDREGEFIAYEIAICLRERENKVNSVGNTNVDEICMGIKRCRFSALARNDILRALNNPVDIKVSEVYAVACRMELDLRIGAAFTRFQTLRLKEHNFNGVVSYGSCQIPTLGFVVERDDMIKNFVPEEFHTLLINLLSDKDRKCLKIKSKSGVGENGKEIGGEYNDIYNNQYNEKNEGYSYDTLNGVGGNMTGNKQNENDDLFDTFKWIRGNLFDFNCVTYFYEYLLNHPIEIVSVKSEEKTKFRPLPLRTVELQKICSSFLKIGSKKVMEIAESLYNRGFVSYPRTETDTFGTNFDFKGTIRNVKEDRALSGVDTSKLGYPRSGSNNDNAHSPIYPIKSGSSLTGDDRAVYEFILRRFIAGLMENAKGVEKNVKIRVRGEEFECTGLKITHRNYLDVYVYEKWNDVAIGNYDVNNKTLKCTGDVLKQIKGQTTPPKHLTESELITLMDKNGIGTDATIHEHINKIILRNYCQKRGNMIFPLQLGSNLIHSYDLFCENLWKSENRRNLESELKRIETGETNYYTVKNEQIRIYRNIYTAMENKIADFIAGMINNRSDDGGDDNNRPGGINRSRNGNDSNSNYNEKKDVDDDMRNKRFDKNRKTQNPRRSNQKNMTDGDENNRNDSIINLDVLDDLERVISVGKNNRQNMNNGANNQNRMSNEKNIQKNTSFLEKSAFKRNENTKNERTGNPNRKIKCDCRRDAALLTVTKQNKNNGRKFFGCALRKCSLFVWEDEADSYRPVILTETNVKCECGFNCKVAVAHSNENYGRVYYKCNKYHNPCNFFEWKND